MNEQQFAYLNDLYRQQPFLFTERHADSLADAAANLGQTFERDPHASDFSFRRTVAQLGAGFVSGFTTLNVGDAPENTIEALSRSVGSLMGFIGYIPGPGLAGKLGATAFGRALGLGALPRIVGTKAGMHVTSIPMAIAKKVTTGLEMKTPAGTAMKFLSERSQDTVRGAVLLGTASAASAWQYGVDDMMKSFVRGGVQGGMFRGLANFVNTGDKGVDKVLRAASSAMFAGIPATLRDEPLEMQVYEYLLGTYFGARELPLHQMQAMRYMQTGLAKHQGDPLTQMMGRAGPKILDPEAYAKLSPEARNEVQQQAIGGFGRLVKLSEELGTGETTTEGMLILSQAVEKSMGIRGMDNAQQVYRMAVDALTADFAGNIRKGSDHDVALENAAEMIPQRLKEIRTLVELEQRPIQHNGMNEVVRALDDHDVPLNLTPPLEQIGRRSAVPNFSTVASEALTPHMLALKERTVRDTPENMERLVAEVLKVDPTLKSYMEEDEGALLLRRTVREFVGAKPRNDIYYDVGSDTVGMATRELPRGPDGKRILKQGGVSALDAVLGATMPVGVGRAQMELFDVSGETGKARYLSTIYEDSFGRDGIPLFQEAEVRDHKYTKGL